MSEAAKRCGIPILALTHALFAIGLVLSLCFGKRPLLGGNNGDHDRDSNDPCRNSRIRRNAGTSGSAPHLCLSPSRSSWNLPPPCF